MGRDKELFSDEYIQGSVSTQSPHEKEEPEQNQDLEVEAPLYGETKPKRITIRGNIVSSSSSIDNENI